METRWSSNSVAASPADINHYSKCPTQLESYLAHLQPALCCRSGEEGQNRTEEKRKEKRQNREEKGREETEQNRTEQRREEKKGKEKISIEFLSPK